MAQVAYGVPAAPKKPVVRPAFTVYKLEGSTTRKKARMVASLDHDGEVLKDKNGNKKYKLELVNEDLPLGYLVKFPKGHSIHYPTYEELEAAGYADTDVPLLQFFGQGDAEEVGSIPNAIGSLPSKAKKGVTTDA